ncbi:MAG: tryptophan synthase subunit alpha [Frankia sp.]
MGLEYVTHLEKVFAAARNEGRAVLIGYLPAGYPSVDGGIDAMRAMVDAGVDVVEVGLPYSDPTMDGPVIQQAVDAALADGVRVTDVLRTVEAVAATGVPTLVMTYWNPVDRYGPAAFARDLAAAGGAGAITPDLPPEESGLWMEACRREGLDGVFLVAPSSSDERITLVSATGSGFVYATAVMGVTGARATVGGRAAGLVARVRALTDRPVAVGLGVSDGDQAAEVAGYADGVIVGSALVRALRDGGPTAVAALTRELAAGVRAATPAGRGTVPDGDPVRS